MGLASEGSAVPRKDNDEVPFAVAQNLTLAADDVLLINPEYITESVTEVTEHHHRGGRGSDEASKPTGDVAKPRRPVQRSPSSVAAAKGSYVPHHVMTCFAYSSTWDPMIFPRHTGRDPPRDYRRGCSAHVHTVWNRTA